MYGFGYGFGEHARRNPVGAAVAASASIVMDRSLWAFGSSSMAGAQQPASGTGGTDDMFTDLVRAIEGLAPGSLAYTTVSGSQVTRPIDYNLTGANAAYKIRNRGVGGQTVGSGGSIVSTMTAAAAGFGASDLLFLHQGDNGVTGAAVEQLAGGYAAMRTQAGARPFVQIVNTRASNTEFAGGLAHFLKDASFRVQSDLNPGKVADFHQALVDRSTAADANDSTDLVNGLPPRSYMMNDLSHQIAKGYALQAASWAIPLVDAVVGGTPFPLKQIVEAVQPAVPAAGDVIGSIVAYGSGGAFLLDASNTQTDYAISASGQITRIGASPPTRDITWMAVKCSKAGRFDKVQPLIGVCERAPAGVSRMVEFDGFSMIGANDTKLANSAKVTLLVRLQATVSATQEIIGCGTSAQIAFLISMTAAGALSVQWRNPANGFIMNKVAIFPNSFRTTDPPRWVAICMDLTDPANEIQKVVSWVDPATALSDTALHANLTADPTTAILARLDYPIALGYQYGFVPNSTVAFKKGRIGDFTIWQDYIDFDVQARREEVSNSDGTPKTAWVTGLGVTDGKTPKIYLKGNAGDFRQCRIEGSLKPATPDGSGQYFGFSRKERSAGVPGYLVTV